MTFAVSIFRPPNYVFTRAFDDVAATVYHGLRALGHDAIATTQLATPGRRTILFGANELPKFGLAASALAPGTIIYNLEQFAQSSRYANDAYLQLLRAFPVWDYSRRNIEWLRGRGIDARHVPIGWMPEISRIAPAATQDIDILFYGCVNERRKHILAELYQRGLAVVHRFGVYGEERDALIARAKVVLNLHFYETKIFEVVRVSYLLSNSACVVSEDGLDPDEAEFAGGLAFSPYESLVATCVGLQGDERRRRELAAAGRRLMEARRTDRFLRDALG